MNTEKSIIRVALVDDHALLRNALGRMIDSFGDCRVTHEFSNGEELLQSLQKGNAPDVVILDLNMPVMNGFETAKWIQSNCPEVHVLMLTMYDSELSLIRLLQAGAKGFLKKDVQPSELRFAIHSVMEAGYYYSNHATGKLVNLFRNTKEQKTRLHNSLLSEQEMEFLKLACSDLTYKEVAQKMSLNPRSVDNLRDQLFIKFDVKSRVGLAMIATRNGLVTF
jgi:DNA-binding NarL/FixJ family response regulator